MMQEGTIRRAVENYRASDRGGQCYRKLARLQMAMERARRLGYKEEWARLRSAYDLTAYNYWRAGQCQHTR
jgi:hypothetical protein